jgi:hypothetical protein
LLHESFSPVCLGASVSIRLEVAENFPCETNHLFIAHWFPTPIGDFHFLHPYARHESVAQLKIKQETEIDWFSHCHFEGGGLVQIRRVRAR